MTIATALIVLSGIFAGVEVFESKGRSLLAWAVLILAVALLIGRSLV